MQVSIPDIPQRADAQERKGRGCQVYVGEEEGERYQYNTGLPYVIIDKRATVGLTR